jgi:Rps23 Pro-64 3,4-dihydroxylase Tpa1-like proline 4-hydroxylase
MTDRIPYLLLDEFLVAQEWLALLDFTFARADRFAQTGVLSATGASSVDPSYRRSRVLFDLEGFATLFTDRILHFFPYVMRQLNQPEFAVRHIELQLTESNTGDFFRMHSDNHSEAVRSRTLTFVYYYHREPKPFEGGELKLWPTRMEADDPVADGEPAVIPPAQNQMIFFPSCYLHEVCPVSSESGEFADSRFTVNGWLHQ